MNPVFLSIVLPCLNEARTLGVCIRKAQAYLTLLAMRGLEGEIIVADNGSTDGSRELATSLGVRLVDANPRGYGHALQAGIKSATGLRSGAGEEDAAHGTRIKAGPKALAASGAVGVGGVPRQDRQADFDAATAGDGPSQALAWPHHRAHKQHAAEG
jgi:hypothetical protein